MRNASPAHLRLRAASAADHARVDACFPQGLCDDGTYRRYLRGMHALLSALSAACPQLASEFSPMHEALAADLFALDAALPEAPPSPPIDTDAARLGARYVIEGSTMGARILQRQSLELGHDARRGARFLAYHLARGQHIWPALQQELATLDDAGVRFDAVLQSTRDTFALAARCFGCTMAPPGDEDAPTNAGCA